METYEVFNACKATYQQIQLLTEEVFWQLSDEVKVDLFDDDIIQLNKCISFVLQGILLKVASLDGDFRYLEMLYLAVLGDMEERLDFTYSDAIEDKTSPMKLAYLMLTDQNKEQSIEYVNELEVYLTEFKNNLYTTLKELKELNGGSEYDQLKELIEKLLGLFFLIDNRDVKTPYESGKELYYSNILTNIE